MSREFPKNFSTIERFQQIFKNRILVAAKLKHPRNYKKLMFEGIAVNLELCYFVVVKFVNLVIAVQHRNSLKIVQCSGKI